MPFDLTLPDLSIKPKPWTLAAADALTPPAPVPEPPAKTENNNFYRDLTLYVPTTEYVKAHIIYRNPKKPERLEDTTFELFRMGVGAEIGHASLPLSMRTVVGGERMRLIHENRCYDDFCNNIRLHVGTPGSWSDVGNMSGFVSTRGVLGVVAPNGERALWGSPSSHFGLSLFGQIDASGLWSKINVKDFQWTDKDGAPLLGEGIDLKPAAQTFFDDPNYQTTMIHAGLTPSFHSTVLGMPMELGMRLSWLKTKAIVWLDPTPSGKPILEQHSSKGFTAQKAEFDRDAGYLLLSASALLKRWDAMDLRANVEGIVFYLPFGHDRNEIAVSMANASLTVGIF